MAILRVFRWSEGASEHYDDFDIAPGPETTVLDALVEAQRTHDPTLAFRYACRVGMCGSCAMVVNGRERWACRTRLSSLGHKGASRTPAKPITIRPLYHFPLIRDLVVDMSPFRQRMARIAGALAPGDNPESYAIVSRDSNERREIDAAIECIGCGMCVSACTITAHNERFPGPAALNRAYTLQMDHRDKETDARWRVLLSDDALARCHGQGNCTEVCPMDLSPSKSILRLRSMAVRSLLNL
jgi:fumarate reductase iron-sulfur subunit